MNKKFAHIDNKSWLRWQCRRGMLELDMILLNFCDNAYLSLSQEEKLGFTQLLSFTDANLADIFLSGRDIKCTDVISQIINKIKDNSKVNI